MLTSDTVQINIRVPVGMARDIEKETKKRNYRSRQEYIMEVLREGLTARKEATP
jgi:Arc/MetJ-type ribon-helix-helix transcriptional regulator